MPAKLYTAIVFFSDGTAKKWRSINNLQRFIAFLELRQAGWKYANIYCSRTKKYIQRLYAGGRVVPPANRKNLI